ncbi:Mbeg1-like protein [Xylocopilactobacillus apis]|uniref:DUF2974 domain-containing protein n=1 Tax=Xylocopilactobacillus apis TaxID=2932183 RepID=A0AAU9DFW7_9LACO|nr:Mbeg1-like protein [Xylocopilactobacillus apis]BDR57151.1 hypothetical protein KIMC2_17130 [Xylocopilactobacillus apis]
MSNIISYLTSYGDKTFVDEPFNELDAAILSQISYLDFTQFTKNEFSQFSDLKGQEDLIKAAAEDTWFPVDSEQLVSDVAGSKRYGQISWSDYLNLVNKKTEQQFSAITFQLSPDLYFLAFGGTDSSILGLKEDLNMSYQKTVPSQISGLKYFKKISQKYSGTFFLGGHSKGGNVAVYAGVHAEEELQQLIEKIFNFDGPGFGKDKSSIKINDKIFKFIPQSSIVGRLLDPDNKFQVVKSDAKGFRQHNLFTWQVTGRSFVRLDAPDEFSQYVSGATSEIVDLIEDDNKEIFINALYELITSTDSTSMTELKKNWFSKAISVLNNLKDVDPELRKVLLKTTKNLAVISFKSTQILFKRK